MMSHTELIRHRRQIQRRIRDVVTERRLAGRRPRAADADPADLDRIDSDLAAVPGRSGGEPAA